MEWNVLFMGPVGSGKTQAIRSISDIDTVDTDVDATDETRLLKSHTTVAMDVGTVHLGGGDKLRIYGAPGQERFDFMWDILLDQAKAVVLLLNHTNPDPLSDFDAMLGHLEQRTRSRTFPLVVGVTHTDVMSGNFSLDAYRDFLKRRGCTACEVLPPVMAIDAREPQHVRTLLVTLTAMLEMAERYPSRSTQAAGTAEATRA